MKNIELLLLSYQYSSILLFSTVFNKISNQRCEKMFSISEKQCCRYRKDEKYKAYIKT